MRETGGENCHRYLLGDWPSLFLKTRLKWVRGSNLRDFIGDFADAQMGVEQKLFGALHAY